jgi:alkylated DNA nucleotide flippase Atl1
MTEIQIDVRIEPAAEDTDYHIVVWLNWWRVINARGTVIAVCESYAEAESYIANQGATMEQ